MSMKVSTTWLSNTHNFVYLHGADKLEVGILNYVHTMILDNYR